MILLTLIEPPRLLSIGLVASLGIIAVGIGDLPGVRGIGVLEIALGVAAAGLTVAALGGRGRTGTSG
ncbi:MAG: hypothetical protein ACO37U_01625 [Ilumatobacteraceae bacterium]